MNKFTPDMYTIDETTKMTLIDLQRAIFDTDRNPTPHPYIIQGQGWVVALITVIAHCGDLYWRNLLTVNDTVTDLKSAMSSGLLNEVQMDGFDRECGFDRWYQSENLPDYVFGSYYDNTKLTLRVFDIPRQRYVDARI